MKDEEMAHGEIIIVRRGHGGDHDDHHGGVWKIAFADFMTAMMAFFLVMWLINASNEQTKKAVASYFNPIKLTDTTTNSKGIKNPKYGVDSKDKQTSADVTTIDTPAKVEIKLATQKQKFDEQALFVDPYQILAEIEGGVGQDDGANKKFNSENPGEGSSMNKGVSFQDPFDPNSWSANQQEGAEIEGAELAELDEQSESSATENGMMNAEENDFADVDEADLEPAEVESELKEEQVAALDQSALEQPQQGLEGENTEALEEGEGKTSDTETGAPLTAEETEEGGVAKDKTASGEAEAGTADGEVTEKITEAAADIKKQLDAALTKSNLSGLDVEVKATSEGVLVVLSDNNSNGMFTIGSARPTPSLVQTMRKLGGIVSDKDGKVVISGHTDGRKYQSGDYDNWRLSTARAHMAYYMLVRGGLAEDRVEKIVGQAAVNLKVPDDPNAAANRRIEVVIKPI